MGSPPCQEPYRPGRAADSKGRVSHSLVKGCVDDELIVAAPKLRHCESPTLRAKAAVEAVLARCQRHQHVTNLLLPGVRQIHGGTDDVEHVLDLSLIHISEPTRLGMISYAVFCLKKKKKTKNKTYNLRN